MLHEGLDWALCDTDSMAIAKPAAMSDAEFERRVEAIRGWFDDLNPYAHKTSLLKLEDVNFGLGNGKLTKELQPLYCLAVSAKRYALFNIANDGGIVLRKASAHGLGHFLPPYTEATAPLSIPAPEMGLNEIGVERWQYDLWHQVVRAALDGLPDQVNLDYHTNFNLPAASQYAAPTLSLRRFGATILICIMPTKLRPTIRRVHDLSRALARHCPKFLATFGDSNSFRAKRFALPKPVAPYDMDPSRGAKKCFDRDTGVLIPASILKSYKRALGQYHLRRESKFGNGDYFDRGITGRRHVKALGIRNIGKESNRWEERYHLGRDESAQIDYGSGVPRPKRLIEAMIAEITESVSAKWLGRLE